MKAEEFWQEAEAIEEAEHQEYLERLNAEREENLKTLREELDRIGIDYSAMMVDGGTLVLDGVRLARDPDDVYIVVYAECPQHGLVRSVRVISQFAARNIMLRSMLQVKRSLADHLARHDNVPGKDDVVRDWLLNVMNNTATTIRELEINPAETPDGSYLRRIALALNTMVGLIAGQEAIKLNSNHEESHGNQD